MLAVAGGVGKGAMLNFASGDRLRTFVLLPKPIPSRVAFPPLVLAYELPPVEPRSRESVPPVLAGDSGSVAFALPLPLLFRACASIS